MKHRASLGTSLALGDCGRVPGRRALCNTRTGDHACEDFSTAEVTEVTEVIENKGSFLTAEDAERL